jgi:hypothetical protein
MQWPNEYDKECLKYSEDVENIILLGLLCRRKATNNREKLRIQASSIPVGLPGYLTFDNLLK